MNAVIFSAPPASAVVSAGCLNRVDLDAVCINATAAPPRRRAVMSMAARRYCRDAVDGTELTAAGRSLT
ncbi:hypothetical protein [Salinicola lusitanus]|uniref:hypothetical protein n=1 Tax=Salinicola lusitanus TaxID=1949085 RepID=UPI000DA2081B|nr:hypothetical protein [Salinicola lusitanus]